MNFHSKSKNVQCIITCCNKYPNIVNTGPLKFHFNDLFLTHWQHFICCIIQPVDTCGLGCTVSHKELLSEKENLCRANSSFELAQFKEETLRKSGLTFKSHTACFVCHLKRTEWRDSIYNPVLYHIGWITAVLSKEVTKGHDRPDQMMLFLNTAIAHWAFQTALDQTLACRLFLMPCCQPLSTMKSVQDILGLGSPISIHYCINSPITKSLISFITV